jgi:Leucine-rich repeat (LRR) protein
MAETIFVSFSQNASKISGDTLYKYIRLDTIDKYKHQIFGVNCSNSGLYSIPKLDLPQLKIFKCSNNQLTSLHDLHFKNLEILECYYNNLTRLPKMDLPCLKYFNCSNNQ